MNDISNEAIEYANRFAKAAPKGFEIPAFETALAHYLKENEMKTIVNSKNITKKSVPTESHPQNYLNKLLDTNYDWSTTNIRNLPPLGQYLKILKIAKTKFQIDTLSSEDIKTILNTKFRINKTVNTIGMSLMDGVGKYVDRMRRGNGYHYTITAGGEERLQQLEEKSGEKHV